MKYIQLLTLLFVSTYSYAQPGTLDNDFDANGIATFDFFGNRDNATDMAIQPDGKIVFCGTTNDLTPESQDLYAARINPDGSLDNTFGDSGLARATRVGEDEGTALAIQADGKIVVGGSTSWGTGSEFYIVRFDADGSPDPNFGIGGQVVHEAFVGLGFNTIRDIAVQPDGKIMVLGRAANADIDYDVVLVRFNPDGSLDNTFSFDGQLFTDVGSDNIQEFYLHDNGKITAVGDVFEVAEEALIIRYNADGNLDDSFGSNGMVLLDLMSSIQRPTGITVTPAGETIIAGYVGASGNYDVLVARLLPDGTLDNTFSFDGMVQTDFGDSERGNRVFFQPDSKILVAGSSDDGMALFRYNWDGTLDNTFGTNGLVATSSPLGGGASFNAVSLQEDGKIVACGTCRNSGFTVQDACVARYLSGINIGIGEVDAYIGSTLIYPNPITNNSITVEYELKVDETVSIELYDLAGKQISMLQSATDEKANTYQKTLSLPTLSAGNYLLKLNTEKGAVSVKLMVN